MDAVKNLKTNAITDQYFDLEFTHSGDAEGFHITVTNAVIARYVIEMKAVGNAYDYYGDNEDIEKNQAGASDDNALMLSLRYGLPVSTNAGEYKWLKFTATSDGYYTFYSEGDYDSKAWFFRDMSIGNNADIDTLNSISASSGYGYDDGGEDQNFSKTISLTAGGTVYIAVGYYSLGVSQSLCKPSN